MSKTFFISICLSFSLITFSQNNPPVADPGDDYYGTRNEEGAIPVTLHAYGSYDADMPDDEITKYKWDTDNDGLYGTDDTEGSYLYSGEYDAEGVEVDIQTDWYPGNTFTIHLIVEDSYGETSSAVSTTVTILPNSTSIPVNLINVAYDNYVSGNGLIKLKIQHPWADAQVFDISASMLPDDIALDCFDDEENPITQLYYPGGNVKTEYDIFYNSTLFEDAVSKYRLKIMLSKSGEMYEIENLTRLFIIDNTPPEITCQENQVRPADESDLYTASGTEFDPVSATDNLCDPGVSNNINLLETLDGYSFNTGTTNVTWTAEDLAGNTDQCSFDVEISPYTDIMTETSKTLYIYPNPAANYLVVDRGSNHVESIGLIDQNGRKVINPTIGHEKIMVLDISELGPGLYTVLIEFADQTIATQKVIISK